MKRKMLYVLMIFWVIISVSSCNPGNDQVKHTLKTDTEGDGYGEITSKPKGISCEYGYEYDCSHQFNKGADVILTADPDNNSEFAGWTGDCSGAEDCVVEINTNKTVSAIFNLKHYPVQVSKSGTGSGTVTSSPSGIDCGDDCLEIYKHYTRVALTAIPDANSTFSDWTGSVYGCKEAPTCELYIYEDESVTAIFNIKKQTLNVGLNGNGSGTITSLPTGINCRVDCSEIYDINTAVALTAVPAAGSLFTGWSGACTGIETCNVVLDGDKTVSATFSLPKFALNVSLSGSGFGTVVSNPGINCGADCDEYYYQGTSVFLTAIPKTGSKFSGWQGACSGTETCKIVLTEATSVTAMFSPLTVYALSASVGGPGTMVSSPVGINCKDDCYEEYEKGTNITLTATANTDALFVSWSGSCVGEITTTCALAMDYDKTVGAKFKYHYKMTIAKQGAGQGKITSAPAGIDCGDACEFSYDGGTAITLTATPDQYFRFDGWSGACSGIDPCVITLNSNTTVSASFSPIVKNRTLLNFSPYLNGQDPNLGSQITEQQMRDRLEIIKLYADWVRFFGSSSGLENGCTIAHEMGFKVVASAWLGKYLSANETEIANLIAATKACQPEIIVVGSEVLLRNDLTEAQIIEYINRVKAEIPVGIPIAYADIYSIFWDRPNLVAAIDIVFANFYPYWEGTAANRGIASLNANYDYTVQIASGKQVIVSETGWPSCGDQIGAAVPSPESAAYYFKNAVSWATAKNATMFYFEAFDELWKTQHEGPQGACWGIWEEDGIIKNGMREVFAGNLMNDNWSSEAIPGGYGDPIIEFTYVPPYGSYNNLVGQVWHVYPFDYRVAVYIRVGSGWWTKPYWNNPLTGIKFDGSFVTDITTGGIDQKANTIVAYLLPAGYNPPLLGGQASLPQELEDKAVAKVITTR